MDMLDPTQYIRHAHVQASSTARSNQNHKEWHLPQPVLEIEDCYEKTSWAKKYLRIAPQLAGQCEWQLQYEGEPVDDPLADAIIKSIKPLNGSQQEMRKTSIFLQGLLGVHAVAKTHKTGMDLSEPDLECYEVYHPSMIGKSKQRGFLRVGTSVYDTKKGFDILPSNLIRNLVKHPVGRDDPLSLLEGCYPEMFLHCGFLDLINSQLDQGKVVQKIVQLNPATDADGKVSQDAVGQVQKLIKDYNALSAKAYKDGGSARALPYETLFNGEITVHNIGEPIQMAAIEAVPHVAEWAAWGLDVPQHWIFEGEGGSANRWGDAEARRALQAQHVTPQIDHNDSFWTEKVLWPKIWRLQTHAASTSILTGTSAEGWSLVTDKASVQVKQDNHMELLEMWKSGVVDRETVAASLGEEMMELEEGVTEYEHLLTMQGKTLDNETPEDTNFRADSEPKTALLDSVTAAMV